MAFTEIYHTQNVKVLPIDLHLSKFIKPKIDLPLDIRLEIVISIDITLQAGFLVLAGDIERAITSQYYL